MAILDRFGRPLRSLRVSVTDRCNLRCLYCMPEPDYAWLPKDTLLSFEEIGTIADAFCDLGVDRVRLTGGEPLLRRDLTSLVRSLAARPAIRDLALTTNGVLLAAQAADAARRRAAPDHGQPRHARSPALPRHDALRQPRRRAGRDRRGRRGRASTRSRSTRSSCAASTTTSWPRSSSTAGRFGAEVRFIEYMDVGGATRWSPDAVVSRREMLETPRSALRRDHADRRRVVCAGRSLHAARRHGLRHHLVDDRAVLRPATAAG